MATQQDKKDAFFLPKSTKSPSATDTGKTEFWKKMAEPRGFISEMVTAETKNNNEREMALNDILISGVPTPWARAKITAQALSQEDTNDSRTLMSCFRAMRDEWRGLIATLVLRPNQFYLSNPIPLKRTSAIEYSNMRLDQVDILSTYSEMLFEEANLWSLFGNKSTDDTTPTIQLLYFKDGETSKTLVGATSPYTIFFTAINYRIQNDNGIENIKEYDATNGQKINKFSDPTRNRISSPSQQGDYLKIYSFLERLSANKKAYIDHLYANGFFELLAGNDNVQDKINTNEEAATLISNFFEKEINLWKKQIEENLGMDSRAIEAARVPLFIDSKITPKGPLSLLYSNDVKYKWKDGKITPVMGPLLEGEHLIEHIDSLFISGSIIKGWIATDDKLAEQYDKAPVYYIHTKDRENGWHYYFALPLSAEGINLMRGKLDDIVNPDRNSDVVIDAEVKGSVVDIRLKVKFVNSDQYTEILLKTYNYIIEDREHKVFTWPNFRSDFWNKYYFYSELPTNTSNMTRVIPEFVDNQFADELPHTKADIERRNADKLAKGETKGIVDYLVTYPIDRAGSDQHRYEVIESNTAIDYITIIMPYANSEVVAGRLVVKTLNTNTIEAPTREYMQVISAEPQRGDTARVGIDFGSTSTCVFYQLNGSGDVHPMPFSNLRLPLMGFENIARQVAQPDELLFISNEEPINPNGQVKSWLHLHDQLFVNQNKLSEAIIGGVPVNETNIIVKGMDEYEIRTNAGAMKYNMKWDDEAGSRAAFLKMIWLHVCADLFRMKRKVNDLRWSYPSSMPENQVNRIKDTFDNLQLPYNSTDELIVNKFTEAEGACAFASTHGEVQVDTVNLGVDIGGSTSDLLILGSDHGDKRLFTQTSVRLAAGKFFKAIRNSKLFRENLVSFHNSNATDIYVFGIDDLVSTNDPNRAPYYLNNVFDQLHGAEDFNKFYTYMYKKVPFVFALPAYITGLLCFYAGKLLRDAMNRNPEWARELRHINFQYFGKGGRLFEWINEIMPSTTVPFLQACIYMGINDPNLNVDINFINFTSRELRNNPNSNKTEVASGLVKISEDDEILGIKIEHKMSDFGRPAAQAANPFLAFGGMANAQPAKSEVPSSLGHDIIGEKGIRFFDRDKNAYIDLDEMDVLTDEIKANRKRLDFSRSQSENFNSFMNMYIQYLKMNDIVSDSVLRQLQDGLSKINLATFFFNDSMNSESYNMPVFIAEGLNYLDSVLLPTVFKS